MEWSSIGDALYGGRADTVSSLVNEALSEGHSAKEVLDQGLMAGMDRVGKDFKADILYLPEVLAAARAMHAAMEILRPLLSEGERDLSGKVVIGTVKGDLHDIGKNLVGMMMRGAGFEVVDLGIDTPAEEFVEAVKREEPDLLGLSALLTTTMGEMKSVIEVLEEAGVRDKVRVIVGGAPVTEDYAREIGADGYAPNANAAVDEARALLTQT